MDHSVHVDDAFVSGLFKLIEELFDDVNDPYHYPIIRVLVRDSLNTPLKDLADRCAAGSQ
jgi:hypothetical protein